MGVNRFNLTTGADPRQSEKWSIPDGTVTTGSSIAALTIKLQHSMIYNMILVDYMCNLNSLKSSLYFTFMKCTALN